MNVSTPFEDFRKALTVASERSALGVDLSDSEAADVAADEVLARQLYGDWLRRKALGTDSQAHSRRSAERPAAPALVGHDPEPEPNAAPETPLAPADASKAPRGIGCGGIGCLTVIVLVVVGTIIGAVSGGSSSELTDSCYDAQNARSIADSAGDEDSRSTAALEYAVKKAQCEDAGGRVP